MQSDIPGQIRTNIMVSDQPSASSVGDMRNNTSQQTSSCHGMNSSPSESTLLGVAKALVNIGGDLKHNFNDRRKRNAFELDRSSEAVKESCDSSQYSNSTDHSDKSCYEFQSNNLLSPNSPGVDYSSFPLKLMEVLTNDDHKDIISWLAHGRGFMIFQTKEFVANVMPKYFKQTKFPSFTRKLSRWGFKRVQRGPEVGVYYHELFNRDNPNLCMHMRSQRGGDAKTPREDTRGLTMRSVKQNRTIGAPPRNCSSDSEDTEQRKPEGPSIASPREVQPLLLGDTLNGNPSTPINSNLLLNESLDQNNQISHQHHDHTPIGIQGSNIPHEISTSTWLDIARQNEARNKVINNSTTSTWLDIARQNEARNKVINNFGSATPCYPYANGHQVAHTGTPLSNSPKNIVDTEQMKRNLLETILRNNCRNQQLPPQSTLFPNLINTPSLKSNYSRDTLVQSALQQICMNSGLIFNK